MPGGGAPAPSEPPLGRKPLLPVAACIINKSNGFIDSQDPRLGTFFVLLCLPSRFFVSPTMNIQVSVKSSRIFDDDLTDEQRFQLLVTSVRDYAIYMLNPNGY